MLNSLHGSITTSTRLLGIKVCFFYRLLGTATVPLKDLVKDSSHTMQADVNLLDGSNRMTQVSRALLLSNCRYPGFILPRDCLSCVITLFLSLCHYHYFLHCTLIQAKLSLRLEYIPPKPGKGIEGDITATDETDLGAELDDEFGLEDEEGGMDELEGGGAEGVSEAVR